MDAQLDEASKLELQKFVAEQEATVRSQAAILQHTKMCWDTCITSTPSTSFSRSESNCLHNCVDRFLDTSLYLVQRVQQQQQGR